MFRALRAFPPSAMGRTMYLRPRRSRRVTVSTARNEYVRPDHLWRAAGCDRGAQTSPAHAAGRRARIRSSPSALRGDPRAGLARDAVWTPAGAVRRERGAVLREVDLDAEWGLRATGGEDG